jgi:hypothetical protein
MVRCTFITRPCCHIANATAEYRSLKCHTPWKSFARVSNWASSSFMQIYSHKLTNPTSGCIGVTIQNFVTEGT